MADWLSILGGLAATGGGAAKGAYDAKLKQQEEARKEAQFQEMIRQFNTTSSLEGELGRGNLAIAGRHAAVSERGATTNEQLAGESLASGKFGRDVKFPWEQDIENKKLGMEKYKTDVGAGSAMDVAREHSRGSVATAATSGLWGLKGDALRAASQFGVASADRRQASHDANVRAYAETERKSLQESQFATPAEKQAATDEADRRVQLFARKSAIEHGAKISTDPISGQEQYDFPEPGPNFKAFGSILDKGGSVLGVPLSGGEGASPGAPKAPGSGQTLRDALSTGMTNAITKRTPPPGFRRPF